MDRLRTLLLVRSKIVWLDPDRISSAQTRPVRDSDLDKLEDELVQLGFVMSLDLAMAVRRLPTQTLHDLRAWLVEALGKQVGGQRPSVPLQRGDGSAYLRRILTWLGTRADQPCPWCGQVTQIGALDPCGHLVCRNCWSSGNFAGCPICHRRVAVGDPFLKLPIAGAHVEKHGGQLALLQLGFDLAGMTRMRFERLLARASRLSADERGDVETIVDAIGPSAVDWLPEHIPVRETMALALARLMRIAPDPAAIARTAATHVRTASDVLRIACVLLGGNAELALPMRFRSIGRGLRRAVLEALDRLPHGEVGEDVVRHAALWKRVGEQLHPGEYASRLPDAAAAFAVARGDRRVAKWEAPVETALRAGDAALAASRLAERPDELLRRADHLVRVARDSLDPVLAELARAMPRATPARLLVLASHVARRGAPWPRRVFFPGGNILNAWGTPDVRSPLRADAIGAITAAARGELLARAEARRNFPRAVIDRALMDIPLARGTWPRGSELALPEGDDQRLAIEGDPLELAITLYDERWRHLETRDAGTAFEFHVEKQYLLGVRHLVATVFARETTPRAVATLGALRFELGAPAPITVLLSIELGERRVRWLGVHARERGELHRVGGYRAALAHIARDVGDHAATHARPTMWDLACIHAAARANVIYVRERDATFTMYRRRDSERPLVRLSRLLSGTADSFRVGAIAKSDAPTFVALVTGDVAIPAGSSGFVLEGPASGELQRLTAAELVSALAPRPA
jgi:hypothetical protein